ncbi:type II toxin-antitoxin system PemK/MazF family toxin [Vibrio splendidus]
MMKVTYHLYDDVEKQKEKLKILGSEVYEQINEQLIPDASNKNATITRYFHGRAEHRWLVRSVDLNGYDVLIVLEPRNIEGEVFLPQTIKKLKRSAMELLRFGTLIEVDFGFKMLVYKEGGTCQTSAKRYPDVVQNQELHKRRPAIVLKTTRRGVQVVPLTSQEPEDYATNSSVFKLSNESVKDCVTLRNKDSYVLSHLIQTVSFSRILPPLSIYKSAQTQRLENYRVRIDRTDERALSTALANNVGLKDYYDNKAVLRDTKKELVELQDSFDTLNLDMEKLTIDSNQLEKSLEDIQLKYDTLRELLKDQYLRAEVCDKSNVDSQIDNEIEEFRALVSA